MASASGRRRVDLLAPVEFLHEHLTSAMCESVFAGVRRGERRRIWTLEVLVRFWAAVVIHAPPSLTQALSEASGGEANGYPTICGTDQGFFERCRTLSWRFFEAVFKAFVASVCAGTPEYFAGPIQGVRSRFSGIFAVDGSALDQVARRLKVLWDDRRIPLPGSVVALYDIGRGFVARLLFNRVPTGKEFPDALKILDALPRGSLVLADALYGIPKFFAVLGAKGVYGLVRRNRVAQMTRERRLSKRRLGRACVEDFLVSLGSGRSTPTQTLRWIRCTGPGRTIHLFTNVLDPLKLSAVEALDLYRSRWKVERMFYDLKEVLNLKRIYAANTNAVAMQVYACAIVYVAMRVAQGRVAKACRVAPVTISTKRFFPKIASASASLSAGQATVAEIERLNPGLEFVRPDWKAQPFSSTTLQSILVRSREGRGRKRRRCPARERTRALPRPPARPPP